MMASWKPQGQAARRLGAGGTAAVPQHQVRRRSGPPDQEIRRHWTYFGADLAYHFQKAQTADALVDIWGADHAGTVKRIKAAVAAMTGAKGKPTPFEVKLVQMVALLRNGEPVKMSKRSGTFVTLADVVKEVGKDVVRFTMLTRKPEAQMDFDFRQGGRGVEGQSGLLSAICPCAHPLHPAQGGGRGLCPRARRHCRSGRGRTGAGQAGRAIPRIVEAAAVAREPHRIAFFLADVASAFHSYWNVGNDRPDKRFILPQNGALTTARLFLGTQIGQVVRNGLALLGVEAVEEM
jgi:arginyl-tRNA synthetase